MEIYRQGDVLIVRVDALPEGTKKPIARESGRIVLAHGEVTGHAHAITTPKVKWINVNGDRYLSSDKPFDVVHEEHSTVKLPAGTFKVIQQREYTPEAIRPVFD